ncbi:MAG: DUF4124 domain-containing protein [Pseudomonadota bacterium]
MRMLRGLLLLVLVTLASPMLAQVYEIRDESGRVIGYSDTPPSDGNSARQIEVTETNTAAPPPVVERLEQSEPDPAPEDASPDYRVNISAPPNETTIPMGGGNFTVQASLDPSLREGDQLQLVMNGEPWGEPQAAGTWALVGVPRGQTDLVVQVLDEDGAALAQSGPVRVYVLRPSVIQRARRSAN